MDCSPPGSFVHGIPRQEYWSRLPCFFQGIFPTQGLNSQVPHCRWILYCLSHKGSPRILEWIAYPISRATSQPRNQNGVSSTTLASSFLRKSAWKYSFWVFLQYRNISVIPWTNSGDWWSEEFKFGNNFLSAFGRHNSAVSWHAVLEVWCHSYSWTFGNFIQLLVLQ